MSSGSLDSIAIKMITGSSVTDIKQGLTYRVSDSAADKKQTLLKFVKRLFGIDASMMITSQQRITDADTGFGDSTTLRGYIGPGTFIIDGLTDSSVDFYDSIAKWFGLL